MLAPDGVVHQLPEGIAVNDLDLICKGIVIVTLDGCPLAAVRS